MHVTQRHASSRKGGRTGTSRSRQPTSRDNVCQTTGDLKYDNELRCGIYLGAGGRHRAHTHQRPVEEGKKQLRRPEREKLRHPDNSIPVHIEQGLRHIRQPFNKHPAPRHLHRQRQKDGRQVRRIGAFQCTYIHLQRSGNCAAKEQTSAAFPWRASNGRNETVCKNVKYLNSFSLELSLSFRNFVATKTV